MEDCEGCPVAVTQWWNTHFNQSDQDPWSYFPNECRSVFHCCLFWFHTTFSWYLRILKWGHLRAIFCMVVTHTKHSSHCGDVLVTALLTYWMYLHPGYNLPCMFLEKQMNRYLTLETWSHVKQFQVYMYILCINVQTTCHPEKWNKVTHCAGHF